jgi:putative membrane protein
MWWRLLVGWVLIAVAFYLTTLIVPGIQVGGGVVGYLLVAAVFGLVNAILGPILRIASLPLRILTLGLFSLVINGILLAIVAALLPELKIDGFLTAVVAALVLSILSMLLNLVVGTATRLAR